MAVSLVRTLFLYALVVLSFRLMGKRQIGELQPAELAIAIMVSELASIPMQDTDIPLLYGIVPILTLIVAEIILSILSLKSKRCRDFLQGSPNILIYNGKINQRELRKLRYNLDDLMEELRLAGYPNLSDIDFAILETNGSLSIIPIPEKAPLTPSDLNIDITNPTGLPFLVVSDGKINYSNLKRLKKDTTWLTDELKKHKLKSASDVFYLAVSNTGEVVNLQKMEKKG